MGGGGKGGSSSSSTNNTIRFPPYLENIHNDFLTGNNGYNLVVAFKEAWDNNPYIDREDISILPGYLGDGFTIGDFPSLFDMFGKFMAGLDVEVLWSQVYEETVNGPEADDLIASFSQETLDRMEQESLPILEAGMRDIGAVNSSAFITGRAILESQRQKEVTKFSAQLRVQLLAISQERWSKHLDWNKTVITVYGDFIKTFYTALMDADQLNYKYKESSNTWHLGLFESARSFIGALNGAPAAQNPKEPSQVQKSLGGLFSGIGAGSMFGGWGMLGGGLLGLGSSFF